ncbi:hypothetical protein BGZ79_005281, partial [Entomortierella chlamydospora]
GSSFSDIATLTAVEFFSKHASEAQGIAIVDGHYHNRTEFDLVLGGASYHRVDTDLIPHGYTEVNIVINDNGTEIPSMMIAGHVGAQISSSEDKELSSTGERDTVQPASGWWIFTTLPEGKTREVRKKRWFQ